ncbi:unnamed protein product [Enterobius vermicularis]|uniref:SoHo domain-containing protein n=1 Tax=Enterobius vermicularis TaxID=51028 RepID=A0A0N4V6F6_ENTVE|nr:unnamed protein product [Enterobius vermicularis]
MSVSSEMESDLLSKVQTPVADYEKDLLTDGPIATGYENYVRNCFRSGAKLPSTLTAADQGVSATRMLKMQESFGPSALDDTYDDEILKDPLEALYAEMGLSNLSGTPRSSSSSYRHFPVYTPKQSSEYYSALYSRGKVDDNSSLYPIRRSLKTEKELADEEWRKNNRQMLIDYKDFDSPRLSPYMYQEHPYVRMQDSRIVGSNFVQITSRPKDNFLEKIDRTLAEVRAMPRF